MLGCCLFNIFVNVGIIAYASLFKTIVNNIMHSILQELTISDDWEERGQCQTGILFIIILSFIKPTHWLSSVVV